LLVKEDPGELRTVPGICQKLESQWAVAYDKHTRVQTLKVVTNKKELGVGQQIDKIFNTSVLICNEHVPVYPHDVVIVGEVLLKQRNFGPGGVTLGNK
jgi:hypothetical protein